jgi:tetratricopeptide (TPR) repeat protein
MKPACLLLLLVVLFPAASSAGDSVADAVKLVDARSYDAARTMLEQIVQRDGGDAEARFHLGRLLMGHFRDLDAAEEQLEKAVELADRNAEYHFTLGNLYGAQAQAVSIFSKMSYAGKVKTEFLRAVELDPGSIPYRTALMEYYLQAPGIVGGSVEKAREQAGELVKRSPYDGHLALARVAVYEKNEKLAEQEYRNASKQNPSRWQAYHRLGYLYINQKRVDDAIGQFREYARVAPGDANSWDSLGEGLFAKENYSEALEQFTKAASVSPAWATPIYHTARCYDRMGKSAEALTHYRKFLSMKPSGPDAEDATARIEHLAR